jgi:hypothetical protein
VIEKVQFFYHIQGMSSLDLYVAMKQRLKRFNGLEEMVVEFKMCDAELVGVNQHVAYRVAEAEAIFVKGLPDRQNVVKAVSRDRCPVSQGMLS